MTRADTSENVLRLTSADFDSVRSDRRLETTLTGEGLDENTRLTLALDVGNSTAMIGSLPTWSNLQDVVITDHYAVLANSYRGLLIADITLPEHPQIIGSLATPGKVWDVEVKKNWVFAADTKAGLLVVDIADPSEPRLVASVPAKRAMSLKICNDFAYVVDTTGELLVVDISQPRYPNIVTIVKTGTTLMNVAVEGRSLCLASLTDGLLIYDITAPDDPVLSGKFKLSAGLFTAGIKDGIAFTGTVDKRLVAVDVGAAAPKVVAEIALPDNAIGMELVGNRAYLTCGNKGTLLVDIGAPNRMKIIGRISTGNDRRVAVKEERAFIAGSFDGLKIIDLSRELSLQKFAGIKTAGNIKGFEIAEGIAYLADGQKGLQIIDVTNPLSPRLLGSSDTPGYAWSVTVNNHTAYVADGAGGLRVIDVGNPKDPAELGYLNTPGEVKKVVVDGDRAFILQSPFREKGQRSAIYRVSSIDISAPAFPRLLDTFETPLAAKDLAVSDGLLFLANLADGLRIFNLSDHGDIEPLSSATLPWPQQHFASAQAVQTRGTLAYVANGRAGFQIIDLADPRHPRILSNLLLPGYSRAVVLKNDHAYLLNHQKGVWVIDIAKATAPRQTGYLPLPDGAADIAVSEGLLYFANNDVGLHILPLPTEAESTHRRDARNISAIFPKLPMPGRYQLQAYNRRGSDVLKSIFNYLPEQNR